MIKTGTSPLCPALLWINLVQKSQETLVGPEPEPPSILPWSHMNPSVSSFDISPWPFAPGERCDVLDWIPSRSDRNMGRSIAVPILTKSDSPSIAIAPFFSFAEPPHPIRAHVFTEEPVACTREARASPEVEEKQWILAGAVTAATCWRDQEQQSVKESGLWIR